MATKKINIERALAELETIVEQMESGQMPLEKSLQLFEKGVGLLKQSQQALTQAEHQVKILINDKEALCEFSGENE